MEVPDDDNNGEENDHEPERSPTWSAKTVVELLLVLLTAVDSVAQLISHWV